jgi:histidinol phosphatase-like PHP family hydrolase
VVINSDAHRGADLDAAYDSAVAAAARAGYTEVMYLEENGWRSHPLVF